MIGLLVRKSGIKEILHWYTYSLENKVNNMMADGKTKEAARSMI